jgi:hypothetical protein
MAHTNIIWGVRIYLATEVPQNTDIGLYTDGGTSEFRWIESGVTLSGGGYPTIWNANILSTSGISSISENLPDASRGGGRSVVSGCTISAVNTTNIIEYLTQYGAYMTGSKVEIWEFYSSGTGDSTTNAIIFTGALDEPEWTETELILSANSQQLKRRANILTVISNDSDSDYSNADDDQNGVPIPATFGQIDKAKMVRTAKKESIISNQELFDTGKYCTPYSTAFPCIDASSGMDDRHFIIMIGRATVGTVDFNGTGTFPDLVGMYVKVVDGSKNVGSYRYIDEAVFYKKKVELDGVLEWVPIVDIRISKFFPENLIGNLSATADGNSWVQFVDIDRAYALDDLACKSFLDSTLTNEISIGLDLFSYDAPKKTDLPPLAVSSGETEEKTIRTIESQLGFYPLPQYAYLESGSSSGNSITIDAKLFNNSPDEMDSIRSLKIPEANIALITDSVLDSWGVNQTYGWQKDTNVPGLYQQKANTFLPTTVLDSATTSLANAVDTDSTTKSRTIFSIEWTGVGIIQDWFIFGLEITPPVVIDGYDFDSAYLSLSSDVKFDCTGAVINYSDLGIDKRRFFGTTDYQEFTMIDFVGQAGGASPAYNSVNNFLDDYYSTAVESNDYYYYVNSNTKTGATQYWITGGTQFPLDVESIKNSSIYKVGVFNRFRQYMGGSLLLTKVQYTFDFQEVTISLVKSVSIRDQIFTGVRGRIFNDTWGSRKTSANMISTPIDMIEHVARLQNWSDVGSNVKFGKQYSSAALIKTSGAGSFDDSSLSAVGGTDVREWRPKDLAIAGQILDYNKGWSDNIIRSISRLSWCASRVDNEGYECIHYLPLAATSTESIDLTKIVGSIAPIREPVISDIFCAPMVKYNYNYGSGKYDSILMIKNPNNPDSYTSDDDKATYTSGFQSGNLDSGRHDGSVIWDRCNTLWQICRQIEPAPSEMVELPFVRSYTTALWYLYQWVMWQGKRSSSLDVPYSVGKDYYSGMHFDLTLPHQTNGYPLECLITGLKKHNNKNIVSIDFLILDDLGQVDIYQDIGD